MATFTVIEAMLGVEAKKGQLAMRPAIFTSQQCNIITGVTGMIEGQAIYGMSRNTMDNVATLMLGQPCRTFDPMAASAVAELGNMITGNAMALLCEAGFVCDITPPSIVRGLNVQISTLNIPALVVPIQLEDVGELELTVCLQER